FIGNINPTFNVYDGGGHLTYDGRKLSVDFDVNYPLVDLTQVEGVSTLKEHIEISLDQGKTFDKLAQEDIVKVEGSQVVIYFHVGKTTGSVHVRMDEGVLSDKFKVKRNVAIDTVAAYNTPDFQGYLFIDAPSELAFEDNAE